MVLKMDGVPSRLRALAVLHRYMYFRPRESCLVSITFDFGYLLAGICLAIPVRYTVINELSFGQHRDWQSLHCMAPTTVAAPSGNRAPGPSLGQILKSPCKPRLERETHDVRFYGVR